MATRGPPAIRIVAIESFAQTLDLLHPGGALTLRDRFVREIDQYASFRRPGKLAA